MKRRIAIGFVWFWGLWSTGSTLEFLGVAPAWPFLAVGIAVAVYIVISGLRRVPSAATPRTEPAHQP
jgi:hypothetical protein